MAMIYTNLKHFVCTADFGGGVAVDSRSAPVSR